VPIVRTQNGGGPQVFSSRFSTSAVALRPLILCGAALVMLFLAPLLAVPDTSNIKQETQDPVAFVREILQHEIAAQLQDHALWSYRETKKEDGKTKLYSVYQTRQGEIDRLTAVDGQPLDPKQAQAEDARINRLIRHPREMRSQQHKAAEDGDRARNLLQMLPAAFIYQYDGKENEMVRLKFRPDPKFHVEGHPAQVFHHMEGTLLLDPAHKRLIAISGRLTSEVKFGYGVLGYLAPGGTFEVRQKEVSPGYWEVTMMHVEMRGKALFFKTIGAHENESYTDFKRVPDNTSLEQAAAFVRGAASGD
jgi:hypothetical protein